MTIKALYIVPEGTPARKREVEEERERALDIFREWMTTEEEGPTLYLGDWNAWVGNFDHGEEESRQLPRRIRTLEDSRKNARDRRPLCPTSASN